MTYSKSWRFRRSRCLTKLSNQSIVWGNCWSDGYRNRVVTPMVQRDVEKHFPYDKLY